MEEVMFGPGGKYEVGDVTWLANGRVVKGKGYLHPPSAVGDVFKKSFQMFGKREFLVYGEERHTYEKVGTDVKLETMLFAKHGLAFQDRVILSARNSPEWPTTFIASVLYGAICVPMNSFLTSDDILYAINDSKPKIMVMDGEQFRKVIPLKSTVEANGIKVFVFRYSKDDAKHIDNKTVFCLEASLNDIASESSSVKEDLGKKVEETGQKVTPTDTFTMLYTSGTTGPPKGVVLTHQSGCTQLFTFAAIAEMKMLAKKEKGLDVSEQGTVMCTVPLFHVAGCHHNFLIAIVTGSRLVTMHKWDPAEALRIIEKERPANWTGVPTMIQDIMEHPDFDKTDTSSLLIAGGGGAPTPVSQVTKVRNKFENAYAANAYGLSETNGGISINDSENLLRKPTSCGQPFRHVEICLVNPDQSGSSLEEIDNRDGCAIGELMIKTPLNFQEYWNKPEKSAEALVEVVGRGFGWFRSGDIANIDSENFIHILDRAKDLIIRGGENISCAEIESVVYSHPDILEAAVFGVKDDRLGEEVGVAVVPKAGSTASEATLRSQLVSLCREKLSAFKVPLSKHIFVHKETLPRGATGKIQKRAIRDHWNSQLQSKL